MIHHTISKQLSRLLSMMLMLVWVNQTFARPDDRSFDLDPITFTVITKKVSVAIGEEFEVFIECRRRSLIDSRLVAVFSDPDYRIKVVVPDGFEQTGGDYYDFIGGRLLRPGESAKYVLRGKFNRIPLTGKFLLLRGTRQSVDLNKFLLRGEVTVQVHDANVGSNAKLAAFSQCLESEAMNGATGPVTSDPNASGGQTRGAENQYNHYVDYPVSVPASGNYSVTLRYYASLAPNILLQVNGGSNQTIALPSSGSWNIVYTEKTLTVSLNAGANTIRIAGVGGGSCRQDKICINAADAPCQVLPSAPVISKVSGTTVCAVKNQSVVLSTSGCAGTVTWFKDGSAVGPGSQITRSDAGSYTANCTVNGCTSANASAISVTQSADCGQGYSQCLESESMNSATGPVTSDPNASGGQTRGAENQYNHYVDYPVNVPGAGVYHVNLRYASSLSSTILVQANGGNSQTVVLPGSGSWNIVFAEKSISVSLNAGANTIRISGTGGATCRQDKICVSTADIPCQVLPSPPTIIKTSGTTVCSAKSQSVVLSASGCAGTVNWFKDGTAIGSGSQITRTDAGMFTANCTVNGCVSGTSAGLSVSQAADCGQTFAQCLEAESMNSATGPVTSDPNASGGQTRGAENQYAHYVDYVLSNVPAPGSYVLKLTYYASLPPNVKVTVNGVVAQNAALPSSGSWNIVPTEFSFNINLTAGSNNIRIEGTGGGSCRQDKICISGSALSPCQNTPAAPVISKTAGTTVCPATNQTVTLTATGCNGNVTWLRNGVQVGTGASIVKNESGNYSATCTVDGCVSASSGTITVSETNGCGNNNPGLSPKISSTGFPEMLTLSIVADPGVPGSWLISDLGTVTPPPGYEWSYFVGNKWIKKSGNLINEPWQTNNPGRVVKMATKIGLDTLNKWPCPPDGCGGYYQSDAVVSLGPGMRGGLTTFIFN